MFENSIKNKQLLLEFTDTHTQAFKDAGFSTETSRIIKETITYIKGGLMEFKLRDSNGNEVGRARILDNAENIKNDYLLFNIDSIEDVVKKLEIASKSIEKHSKIEQKATSDKESNRGFDL